MHMKPLDDRVIVRRLGDANNTSGGIVPPDTVQDKSIEGEVIALREDDIICVVLD